MPKTVDQTSMGTTGEEKGVCPVIGLTGTGGAGKSSLTDELVLRIMRDNPGHQNSALSDRPHEEKDGWSPTW